MSPTEPGAPVRDALARAGAVLLVDLAAVRANFRLLRDRAGVEAAAVVKADAYGLGADRVAPALRAEGCRRFFVATPDEGARLREAVPDAEAFVLAGAAGGGADGAVPVLNHEADAARHAEACRRAGRPLPCAVHVDTGMNRLGLDARAWAALAARDGGPAALGARLLISHLACAEEPDRPENGRQLRRFRAAREAAPGIPASLANSSGIFLGPDYRFDLVRPGAALYGINPLPGRPNPMRCAATLYARVEQVRSVDRGGAVGYGAAYRASALRRIAALSVGYADGFLRSLGGRGGVAIAGRRAPVAGRVSMDLVTVDVTGIPPGAVEEGTPVEVFGPNAPLDDLAADAGTIGYELLAGIGRRVPRIHADRPR